MTCEVCNKEINSQCAELLVRRLYLSLTLSQGNEWVRQCMSKSITEIEIEAALSEEFNCTQCFFYFRDEDYVYKKFPNPTQVIATVFS